ncbi:MarR family transcriptional regulator [Kribbella shirazensis]|uniref:DNA-binding MarR family transcriptional regulator n=1 Tax=Kribbella shirazensis TaxID=1105143 RepID=A0A7X5ZZ20_9ACTN|nr:DNA-binding MarR family transcriptional regulator [Kribbella shirazensis]
MSKQSLIAVITGTVARFQDATDRVDAAAAAVLGLNRTDLLCLGVLARGGPLPAGQLAVEAGLSPAAMTAGIERLEKAGYADRTRDSADRRRVLVTATPLAVRRLTELYAPLEKLGSAQLAKYSLAELETIRDFLDQGIELQDQQADRIRGLLPSK